MITNFSTLCLHLWSDRRQIRPLGCGGGRQINSSWFGLGFQRGVKVTKDFILLTIVSILDQSISMSTFQAFIQSTQKFASRLEVYSMCIVLPTLFLPRRRVLSVILCITALRRKDPLSPQSPHPRKMSSSRQFHPGQNAINFVYDFFQCQTGGPFLSMPACSLAAF